jgi:D-alanine-D-alanine ligase
MINKHIEIVRTNILELSSMGQKSCNMLYEELTKHYRFVGVTEINGVNDLELLVAKNPDLVFMGMKFIPHPITGKKIWISEYLSQHNIAHTGSPKSAIVFDYSKPLAKQHVLKAELKTSQYKVIKNGNAFDAATHGFNFPLFIKPTNLGGGEGIDLNSVVNNQQQLDKQLSVLFLNKQSDVLIENYLSGREFSVAVLKSGHSDELLLMPLELLPAPNVYGQRILTQALKSAVLETPVAAVTDPIVKTALMVLAQKVFVALGARDYGRIDIRMDAKSVPHFLEANLVPCIIEGSGNFPKACMLNMGMDYSQMRQHIVRLGLSRSPMPHDKIQNRPLITV